jgi:hypothetical protein
LGPILDTWFERNERKAVKQAGGLTFWRDGMMAQIQRIMRGDRSKETFDELRRNLDGSKEEVTRTVQSLRDIRGKLGASKIAEQVDRILYAEGWGKGEIRVEIAELLRRSEEGDVTDQAFQIYGLIQTLNGEIQRLYRMVHQA